MSTDKLVTLENWLEFRNFCGGTAECAKWADQFALRDKLAAGGDTTSDRTVLNLSHPNPAFSNPAYLKMLIILNLDPETFEECADVEGYKFSNYGVFYNLYFHRTKEFAFSIYEAIPDDKGYWCADEKLLYSGNDPLSGTQAVVDRSALYAPSHADNQSKSHLSVGIDD